jgi:DNA-binding CsgD family transcriptional regulator
MTQDYETLVGSIYDSAADPAQWPDALARICDAVDAAYVGIGMTALKSGMADKASTTILSCSSADYDVSGHLGSMMTYVPDGQAVLDLPEDVSWTQLSRMQESEFRKTSFYQQWLKPQGLRDVLGVNSIKRKDMLGILTMPTAANREPVTAENRQLVEQLSPHIRRAMTINDLTNNSVLALSLYRQVLDKLSVAVFIVGAGHRIVFTNGLGDALLSDGQLVFSVGGTLKAHRSQSDRVCALDTAIGHALSGDPAGHGVPLVSMAGDMIAAYVLPLAGRSGHCAVFVTQNGVPHVMAVDVLRGMFNLTVAEARVALLIASGKGPQRIAIVQGIAMNTVRTHLKHIFSKMDVQDQTALAGLVTSLLPPVA